MFIACPHCRYLVATDPRTQTSPARCPRCSTLLDAGAATTPAASGDNATSAGQSLASLLRRDEAGGEQVQATTVETAKVADAVDVAGTTPAQISTATVDAGATMTPLANAGQELSTADKPDADAPAHAAPAAPIAQTPAIAPLAIARNPRAPAFLRGKQASASARNGTPRWQWAALIVLLLSLALQMLLADRARLANDAAWRPLILGSCQLLGCSVPPWREPQAFVMLDRDVRPLPGANGVLQARATFRNEAHWSQPWPILLLSLKDADGRDLGARAITPSEYLRGGNPPGELAPGQSAQVAVNIREPSANVVAFSFDFR